jgi:hypothetical protein
MTATQILVALADVLAAVVLLVVSIPLGKGKGGRYLAGYNTASAAEKSRWDEPALCRTMARTLRMAIIGPVLWAIATLLGSSFLHFIGLAVFVGVIFGGLFYANRHHHA